MFTQAKLILQSYKPLQLEKGMWFLGMQHKEMVVYEMNYIPYNMEEYVSINGYPVEPYLYLEGNPNVPDETSLMAEPEQIGWLFIGTCEQSKKYNIDFAKSHQYGVTVSNKNWATDGKLAKIFYTSYAPKIKIKNKEYWKFVACREFKRSVAKTYPENWNMYVAVDPTEKIRKTYQKFKTKEVALKLQKGALETYNESV